MRKKIDMGNLELFINGTDISQYLDAWFQSEETGSEWTVHVGLTHNSYTSGLLGPLNGRKVCACYRLNTGEVSGPWSSGKAELNWRHTRIGTEEVILHGVGRLKKDKDGSKIPNTPVTARVSKLMFSEGKVIEREEEEGTITVVEENPQEKAKRKAEIEAAQEAQIQAITSPEFILFLAKSAQISYQLLYDTGKLDHYRELSYSSFIFLPLSIEYFLKYLIRRSSGSLRREHKIHKLLALFDYLSFDLQDSIDEEFKKELRKIGRDRTFQDLRVFLMKTQDSFTAIRYLFELHNATESRHLLRPENIAVLTCVLNAVESVSRTIGAVDS